MNANTQGNTFRNIETFAEHFFQHAEVKTALTKLAQKSESSSKESGDDAAKNIFPKAPKLLLQAINEDKRIVELAQATRNVMTYYRELSLLLEEKVKGKNQSNKTDKAFIEKWSKIEKDYQTMIKMTCTLFRENTVLMDSCKVLAERPNNIDIFSNPAFLGRDEQSVAKYFGITSDELNIYYEYSYLPNRKSVYHGLGSKNFENALLFVERSSDKLRFHLSPERLLVDDSLSLGGDFFFLASIYAQIYSAITTIIAATVVATLAVAAAAVSVATVAATTVVAAATTVVQSAVSVVQTVGNAVGDIGGALGVNAFSGDIGDALGVDAHLDIDPNIKVEGYVRIDQNGIEVNGVRVEGNIQVDASLDLGSLHASASGGAQAQIDSNMTLDGGAQGQASLSVENIHAEVGGSVPLDGDPSLEGNIEVGGIEVQFDSEQSQNEAFIWPIYPPPDESERINQLQTIDTWQSNTKSRSAEDIVNLYGYALGNMSRSKLELHLPNCSFLHLMAPKNLQSFESIQDGHDAGLDNCYYCIGDSKR